MSQSFFLILQRPSYAPVNFLAASRPAWFTTGFQQDCSEFLKFLLDQLHMQETKFLTNSSSSPKSPSKNKSKTETKQRTLIEENFGGTMTTTLTCLNCGKESRKEEMFMDLPLAFPDYNSTSQKSLAGGDSKMSTRSQTTTTSRPATSNISPDEMNSLHLNDLLKHYLKPEKLVGDNKYYCDNCGGLQEGERKINIIKTPEYLILTLLRFSYDTKLQSRSKIFREVKYPKTLLIPVEDETRGTSSVSRPRRDSLRSAVTSQLEKCGLDVGIGCGDVYSLCSVVIHSGTSSDCGHYYCYARHSVATNSESMCEKMQDCTHEDDIDFLNDKWYLFNDSRVSYASYSSFCNVSQRFTKDTAYVLIYRKIEADKLGGDYSVGLDQSIQPKKIDEPLRSDLRAAVVKDNKTYLQVCSSTPFYNSEGIFTEKIKYNVFKLLHFVYMLCFLGYKMLPVYPKFCLFSV